jgi:ABC-type cobalamin/Fe3+-siderophores transport system ATPase subunit
MELIGEMHRNGHTIILVTHDMKLVTGFSQKSLVLREGKVLVYDDTRTVFKHSEVLRNTQIEPPQITALAKRMVPYGMPGDVLSVEEFYAAYCERMENGEWSWPLESASGEVSYDEF